MAMQVVTGTVVGGHVVLDGAALPEGTAVTVLVRDTEATVTLSPEMQRDLEDALDEADREEGIPADEFIAHLRKYG